MANSEPLPPVPDGVAWEERRAFALARADAQIRWYESHSSRQWWAFTVFQSAAVILGGLTPVLILWTDLPKAVQALPAALAAIAAGLVGIFRWADNKARWSFTSEALKSERVKYATRTTAPYGRNLSDDEALDNFVARIENLAMTEVVEWRGEFARTADNAPDDAVLGQLGDARRRPRQRRHALLELRREAVPFHFPAQPAPVDRLVKTTLFHSANASNQASSSRSRPLRSA